MTHLMAVIDEWLVADFAVKGYTRRGKLCAYLQSASVSTCTTTSAWNTGTRSGGKHAMAASLLAVLLPQPVSAGQTSGQITHLMKLLVVSLALFVKKRAKIQARF
jgi:hypothetical protein